MKDKIFGRLLKPLKDLWVWLKGLWVRLKVRRAIIGGLWVRPKVRWMIIIGFFIIAFIVVLARLNCEESRGICKWFGVKEKGEAIKMLGTALIAVVGIYVASHRLAATDKAVKVQAETAEGDKERRIQERFRDAVKLLGHEKESVRLGGAYALFHLALEKESQRKSIAEILCAHIRETTRGEQYRRDYANQPSTEIQSLMALLFEEIDTNKRETLKKFWKGISPNLSGGFFRGIKLTKAQFQGAFLNKAQFQGATLQDAQFQGATLQDAQFQGAVLLRAQFQGKDFRRTNLQGGQFQGAVLWDARFQGGDLLQAKLQGADLREAQFQKSDLQSAQFQGANLSSVQFQGANLSSVQFQGAVLARTQFQEATLFETKFQGVHFLLAGVPISDSRPRWSSSFESQIRRRIGKKAKLSTVIFEGGLYREMIDNIASGLEGMMLEDEITLFKARLQQHVGQPASNIPPEGGGIKTDEYNEEEANQWIAEYENAMGWKKDT